MTTDEITSIINIIIDKINTSIRIPITILYNPDSVILDDEDEEEEDDAYAVEC